MKTTAVTTPERAHLASQIRAWRIHTGFSFRGLSRVCKIPSSTIVRLERQDSDPCYSTLVRVARGLGISLTHLLFVTPANGIIRDPKDIEMPVGRSWLVTDKKAVEIPVFNYDVADNIADYKCNACNMLFASNDTKGIDHTGHPCVNPYPTEQCPGTLEKV